MGERIEMNKKLSPQQKGLLKILTPKGVGCILIGVFPLLLAFYLLKLPTLPTISEKLNLIMAGILIYLCTPLGLLLVNIFLKWKWGIDNTKPNLSIDNTSSTEQTDTKNLRQTPS